MVTTDRGYIVAKKWPRTRPGKPTPAQKQAQDDFKRLVKAQKSISSLDHEAAVRLAKNSGYTWRDVVSRAMTGQLIEFSYLTPEANPLPTAQELLEQLGNDDGMIIINVANQWVAIPIGLDRQILTVDPVTHRPAWDDAPISGIDQLHGDVVAGPGAGDQAATLVTTAVTPGSYSLASLTVDSKGRLTAASTGSVPAYINQLHGDVTAGPGSGDQATTLANTGVGPGTYTNATITLDAKGRATSATSGAAPAGIATIPHPGFASSRYYSMPGATSWGSAVMTASRLYAHPFYVGTTTTFTEVSTFCNGGVSLAEITAGIYTNLNGKPDSLIQTFGIMTMTSSSQKSITGLTITLAPGWYWLAVVSNLGPTIKAATNNANQTDILGYGTNLSGGACLSGVQGTFSYNSGTLPGSFPAATDLTASQPALFLRL